MVVTAFVLTIGQFPPVFINRIRASSASRAIVPGSAKDGGVVQTVLFAPFAEMQI